MHIDGGSNCNLNSKRAIAQRATQIAAEGSISGIAGGLTYKAVTHNAASIGGHELTIASLYTPRGSRQILSESVLLDEYGITCPKDPPRMVWPDNSEVPMIRINGLYYVDITYHPPTRGMTDTSKVAIANAAEAHVAVRADDAAILWAARLDVDHRALLKISDATHGIGIKTLSEPAKQAIDSNVHRARAQAKHAPTGSVPLKDRATKPGETLIADGFGKHDYPSPVDQSVYQFSAIDEHSSFGYIANGKTHTVDDWVAFMRSVVLHARSKGHAPIKVRFDRAPELDNANLKARLEKELGLLVELTPREHHEGVGRAERNHDLLTRMAESMLQRAGLAQQWLLTARVYAQYLLNRRPMQSTGETRYQRYLREVPDLGKITPYAFGTTVSIVEDVRGPKGSLDHPRGSIGRLVGVDGSSYVVYRPSRGTTVHQHHVKPLNELALVRSGLPSSVATVDTATQTLADAVPTPPTPEPPAAPPTAPPTVDLPIGARVEVLWQLKGSSTKAWYRGKVVDAETKRNGARYHFVAYDGWPEDDWHGHNLASGNWQWRRLDDEPDVPAPAPAGPTTRSRSAGTSAAAAAECDDDAALILSVPVPKAGGSAAKTLTRHERETRAVAAAAYAFVESAVEGTERARAEEQLEAALYQALGDDADALDRGDGSVQGTLEALASAAYGSTSIETPTFACAAASIAIPIYSVARGAECYKASQNVVDVTTETGIHQLTVPSSLKQLMESEQRDQWLAAEQKALDAILVHPGNRLVPTSYPMSLGLPIAPCVTQRRIKIDPATKDLASSNAFKARHCVDGGRLDALLKQRSAGEGGGDFASAVACNLLIKMLLSDAAVRDRNLTKADVPNAYPQGKRLAGRPKTYMQMPTAFRNMRGDSGEELCIEMETPMWGETQAGYEWQLELERKLTAIGWRRAEGVPALWIFSSPEGECRLVTVVDDLLFSESKSSGYSIADRTIKLLSGAYGNLTFEHEPDSFAGYKLNRKRTAGTIQLTMEQKVIEAAREHMPELLSGDPVDIPSGTSLSVSKKSLCKLADALEMPTDRTTKLSRRQRQIQQLIGSLKFIEQLHPRLSLVLHRLSCVMACPPEAAWDVARGALAAVYAERTIGITYGGTPLGTSPRAGGSLAAHINLSKLAPAELESHADATWGDRNVYALILTFGGAAVLHCTKKIALAIDSSMETEAIGSSKAGESVAYAREILRALGVPPSGPTLIGTDNLANQRIASGLGCPSRSKHFLRRYFALKQRVAEGEVELRHVADEDMPADFLTKWIPAAKLEQSIAYATGAIGRTSPPPSPS